MTHSTVRRALILSACLQVLAGTVAHAQGGAVPAVLPLAQSLPDELARALRQNQPLVVMVSLEGCVFCRIARQSHLAPYHREGGAIVQVNMRSQQAVRDFEGQMTTHEELVRRWRVSVAPTLIFLGPRGQEVAERMEGGYLPDFYGPYLDARLEKGRALLRRNASATVNPG
jgi:thioredoxin-related protein